VAVYNLEISSFRKYVHNVSPSRLEKKRKGGETRRREHEVPILVLRCLDRVKKKIVRVREIRQTEEEKAGMIILCV